MTDTFPHRLSVLKELRGRWDSNEAVAMQIVSALKAPADRFSLLWEMMDRLEGLETASKRLCVMARTSGGVAGPDSLLMEACDQLEELFGHDRY